MYSIKIIPDSDLPSSTSLVQQLSITRVYTSFAHRCYVVSLTLWWRKVE